MFYLPWIIHGPVLQMLDQGYSSEDIHVTGDEIEYPWQGTEGGGQINVGDQVGEGVNVQYSVLSLGVYDLRWQGEEGGGIGVYSDHSFVQHINQFLADQTDRESRVSLQSEKVTKLSSNSSKAIQTTQSHYLPSLRYISCLALNSSRWFFTLLGSPKM